MRQTYLTRSVESFEMVPRDEWTALFSSPDGACEPIEAKVIAFGVVTTTTRFCQQRGAIMSVGDKVVEPLMYCDGALEPCAESDNFVGFYRNGDPEWEAEMKSAARRAGETERDAIALKKKST